MIPNELPFIVFYYVAAATLVAALQGDLGNAVGGIALGLALLTTAALAVIVVRAVRTGAVARSAVRDALGIDVPRRRLPMLRILLAPVQRDPPRRGAHRERGLWRRRRGQPCSTCTALAQVRRRDAC